MEIATGTFEVSLKPLAESKEEVGATLGRMSIDKLFHGDLKGIGQGEMLTALSEVEGSGVYVAIERVTGELNGRQGSFVFRHLGITDRGVQQLTIAVVPDTGTERLVGLTGEFFIEMIESEHVYRFEYALPQTAD